MPPAAPPPTQASTALVLTYEGVRCLQLIPQRALYVLHMDHLVAVAHSAVGGLQGEGRGRCEGGGRGGGEGEGRRVVGEKAGQGGNMLLELAVRAL